MIRTLTICAGLVLAGSAHAQNAIYDTVGLGYGGSAKITPGGTGPNASDASDPYGANINITVGGSVSNLPLYDLSVGFVMYYLPIMGNGGTFGSGWQCVPGLSWGLPHGPNDEVDPWPVDTNVQLVRPSPEVPNNVYYLAFHTGGNFHSGGGFPIGHELQVQFVCAKRAGQP